MLTKTTSMKQVIPNEIARHFGPGGVSSGVSWPPQEIPRCIDFIVVRHRSAQLQNRFHRRFLLPRSLYLRADPTHPDARQENDDAERPQGELETTAAVMFRRVVHARTLAELTTRGNSGPLPTTEPSPSPPPTSNPPGSSPPNHRRPGSQNLDHHGVLGIGPGRARRWSS